MNFSQGHSGTKVQFVNRACFPKEKTTEFTKMGEIHENFSFWPFLWFGLPGRLLIIQKSEGNFSDQNFPGEFFPGDFLWWISLVGGGLCFLGKDRTKKKNPPQIPRQNSNQNLGASRQKSTLQGPGLDTFKIHACAVRSV